MVEDARSILCCLRYGIGDVVMQTPTLEALRVAAPHATIACLGAAPATDLVRGDHRIDEVAEVQRWGLSHRWDEGDEGVVREISGWLAERDFDLILEARHAPPAVASAANASVIPRLESDEGVEAAVAAAGGDGVAAIKAGVRRGWSIDVAECCFPNLHITPAERALAERCRGGVSRSVTAPLGISPVTSISAKRWPIDRFAAVADALVEEGERAVWIFAGDEVEAADRLIGSMRHQRAAAVIDRVDLRLTAALLERCGLFIASDTGLMHMAAAVGTPTVGIFGPSDPAVYLPPGEHTLAAVGSEIDCPHRRLKAMSPPRCWETGHCLVAPDPCTRFVSIEQVQRAASRLGSRSRHGLPRPADFPEAA